MSVYFARQAEQSATPSAQKNALVTLSRWYGAKLRQLDAERGEAAVEAEGEPVLGAVQRDPDAVLGEFKVCTDRALGDPAFNSWVASGR